MSIEVRIVEGEVPARAAGRPGPGVGSVIVFEGCVRGEERGRAIRGLAYEVYEVMAERELERLAREALARHGLTALRVWHSRGFVAVAGCSLRVEVDSPHRMEGLRALQEFIDALKRDVPIWKRPEWAGGPA